MNLKVSKLLILFVTICIGVAFKSYADTNLGNGASFSGKVKKGQLTGDGTLTLHGEYNQPFLSLSGKFHTSENGRTQATGNLYFSNNSRPAFQNATFEFDAGNFNSICIKKGAKINTESVEVLTPNGTKSTLSNLAAYTTEDEHLIINPETRNLTTPSQPTPISFDSPTDNKKYTGYGMWGMILYIIEEFDETHFTQYQSGRDGYVVLLTRNGDEWVRFDNDQKLIEIFSKIIEGKRLSGEFAGIINDTSGNPRFVKYTGSYTDGNGVYQGEFQLPYEEVHFSDVQDNMKAYNSLNVSKQPYFLSSTREIVNGTKNHKKLKLSEGGTILSHIKPSELNTIDSLTIVGIMYASDMKIIGEMPNLEYLDLSNAFITYSPQEKEEQREDREFQDVFLKLMSGTNESKLKSKEITQTQYENNKLFLEILNKSKDVEPKTDPCYVPSINNLPALRTLILPTYAKWINRDAFNNCPNLETVILPEYLKSIYEGCFQNCVKLNNVTFSNTLKYVYFIDHDKLPFFGCSSLEEIDFGHCNFTDPDNWYRFPGCHSLKKFVFPGNTRNANFSINNSLTNDIYFPATIKEQSVSTQNSAKGKANLHFKSKTPPQGTPYYKICQVIYIPKGSLTEYYSAFGKDFEYIEE